MTPPGDLPDPGIEPRSPTLQANSSPSEPQTLAKVIISMLFPTYNIITVSHSSWDEALEPCGASFSSILCSAESAIPPSLTCP